MLIKRNQSGQLAATPPGGSSSTGKVVGVVGLLSLLGLGFAAAAGSKKTTTNTRGGMRGPSGCGCGR